MTTAMAVSDTCHLLVQQSEQQLVIYDLSCTSCTQYEVTWPHTEYGLIRDVCWAPLLNGFLILTEDVICLYSLSSNELKVQLTVASLNDFFWSITVIGREAYVIDRQSTLKVYTLPLWTNHRHWSRSQLINRTEHDQFIERIRSHPSVGLIVLLIRMKRCRQWRIDCFNTSMQKLFSGESVRMISAYPKLNLLPSGFRQQWILINEHYVWLIDARGHFLKRYWYGHTDEEIDDQQ
jgi:hypothetical protein